MEIADTIKKVIQEIIVPELDLIRAENAEIKATLQITNKRLDDINLHLADLSRRIDEINKRIDRLYEVIVRREEHEKLELKVMRLEEEIAGIKAKIAV
ncbi:MAG: hypothetical protein AB1480_08090 [Nitrospirota bacterium]